MANSYTGYGGLNISAADLKNLNTGANDIVSFTAFDYIDDSEEYYGGTLGWDDVQQGDVWLCNIQAGYSSDVYHIYGVTAQDDNDNAIWRGHHDENGLNANFIVKGDEILDGNAEPGNVDILIQQSDTSNSGVNYQLGVYAIRLKSTESEGRNRAHGLNGLESLDA